MEPLLPGCHVSELRLCIPINKCSAGPEMQSTNLQTPSQLWGLYTYFLVPLAPNKLDYVAPANQVFSVSFLFLLFFF